MSIRCFFGIHEVSLTSIVDKPSGFTALCERCGLPLQKRDDERWAVCPPLSRARRSDEP